MNKSEKPYKSGKFDCCPEFEDKILSDIIYLHDDLDEDEFLEGLQDHHEDEGETIPPIKPWNYETNLFSLKDILGLVPSGSNPQDVMISIHRDRHVEYVEVKLTIRTPTNKKAWQAGYDAEEADYQKRLEDYNKKCAIYDEWKLKKDIKELETKLANIKK